MISVIPFAKFVCVGFSGVWQEGGGVGMGEKTGGRTQRGWGGLGDGALKTKTKTPKKVGGVGWRWNVGWETQWGEE